MLALLLSHDGCLPLLATSSTSDSAPVDGLCCSVLPLRRCSHVSCISRASCACDVRPQPLNKGKGVEKRKQTIAKSITKFSLSENKATLVRASFCNSTTTHPTVFPRGTLQARCHSPSRHWCEKTIKRPLGRRRGDDTARLLPAPKTPLLGCG